MPTRPPKRSSFCARTSSNTTSSRGSSRRPRRPESPRPAGNRPVTRRLFPGHSWRLIDGVCSCERTRPSRRAADMDRATRQLMIEQYKQGYRDVASAIAGATEAELDARPGPGQWTAREIVHHLADSEMTSAIRLRNLIATDNVA